MTDFEFAKAMVVVPHQDDGELLAGGSMAKWASEGKEVVLVVVTNGAAGSNDPDVEREWLISTREQEQRDAATITGISEVVFLGYEDGYVEDSHELRRDLIREIRRFKPDVVVGMDPVYYAAQRYINHPDHRKLAEALLAAVNPGSTTVPLYRPDLYDRGFGPHQIKMVLLGSWMTPEYFIDISDFIETKIQATLAHKSQMSDPERVGEWVRMRAKAVAEASKTRAQYCEGFKVFYLGMPPQQPSARTKRETRRKSPAKKSARQPTGKKKTAAKSEKRTKRPARRR